MTVTTSTIYRTVGTTLLLTALCAITPPSAQAVRWEPLARTGRHDVAIDTGSVRLTSLSRLAVWLRFVPLGEQQRQLAAIEYGQRSYRLHLEYYEIDCSEQNAVLGALDILGSAGKRITRTKGGSTPDAIIPGSVLDMAANKICPAVEEESTNAADETEAPDSEAPSEAPEEKQVSEELQKLISEAIKKTEESPKDLEVWRSLGNAYFDADMNSQSIAAYSRALEIKPDDTNILNDQGAMYRQIGDFIRALANFDKAHQADPYNLESLYNSGYVLAFDLNQIDKALVLWQRYLTLDRTSETSRQVQSFIDRYGSPTGSNVKK
jgi:tetratricopeptide (TPR) repeat protein